jgi:XTP/dITP diphosphohydrolase/tetrapyrrole methylase family protein/MazG family protein/ATP diphosphatase
VLFQVVFLSLLLEERGAGSLGDVADEISEKLIRRHPHVFGEGEAEEHSNDTRSSRGPTAPRLTSREVLRNWDRIKREVEGRGADDPFADIPETLPALLYARKVLRRADPEGGSPADRATRDEAEAGVGELLMSAVAIARRLGVDPELALRAAADRVRDGAR